MPDEPEIQPAPVEAVEPAAEPDGMPPGGSLAESGFPMLGMVRFRQ